MNEILYREEMMCKDCESHGSKRVIETPNSSTRRHNGILEKIEQRSSERVMVNGVMIGKE
jgi:hypothetical protein